MWLLPEALVIGDVPASFLRDCDIRETSSVVSELAEHLGAKNRPESWQGTDDLRVRVRLKML
jgi:hypothetical protein